MYKQNLSKHVVEFEEKRYLPTANWRPPGKIAMQEAVVVRGLLQGPFNGWGSSRPMAAMHAGLPFVKG